MIARLGLILRSTTIAAVLAVATSPGASFAALATPVTAAPTFTSLSCGTCWSGYEALAPSIDLVSATWTVPCLGLADEAPTDSAIWVGMGGVDNINLVQTGTRQWQGYPDANGNVPTYYQAWVENVGASNPAEHPLDGSADVHGAVVNISCGDRISASVNSSGTMVLTDLTNGQSSGPQNFGPLPNNGSVEWIVENTGGNAPLANFRTVTFSNANATLTGSSGASNVDQLNPTLLNIEDWNGAPLDSTGPAGGGQFSISWITSSCEVDPDPNWNCDTGS